MQISSFIIPIFIIMLLIYSAHKKINCYKCFVDGAKSSIDLIINIFPYIVAILCATALFRVSGILRFMLKILSPIFNALSMPIEVGELVLLRPFTGSGSYAILSEIYSTYGVNSYISKCASCIMGSSETIFYVATVYTSKTSIKKLSYALPVGIFASIFGAIISCLICKVV